MSLEHLTSEQQKFVEKYVLKHPFKGGKKKRSAEKFNLSRFALDQYINYIPRVDKRRAEFVQRNEDIDKLATSGSFKDARIQAEELMLEMVSVLQESAAYYQKTWRTIKEKVASAGKKMVEFYQWRDQEFKPAIAEVQSIPENLMPTEQDLSTGEAMGKFLNISDLAEERWNQIDNLKLSLEQGFTKLPQANVQTESKNLSTLKLNINRGLAMERPPNDEFAKAMVDLDKEVKEWKAPEILAGSDKQGFLDAGGFDLVRLRTRQELHKLSDLEYQLDFLTNNVDWEVAYPETPQNDSLQSEQNKDRKMFFDRNRKTKNRQVRELAKFDTGAFVKEQSDFTLKPGEYAETSEDFLEQKKVAKNLFAEYLGRLDLKPDSDEMFDLSLKSPGDFAADYAVARGWAKGGTRVISQDKLEPNQWAMAQAFGQGMHVAMMEKQSNKFKNENGNMTLQLDGKSYQNGKVIGQGAFGKVLRFEEKDHPENTVVVKSMIVDEPSKRQGLVKEMKNHRLLMKGDEEQPGRKNVVGLQGALQSDDGSLLMVMEEVGGGDLENNRFGLGIASKRGILSEEARTVLNQHRLKQAVQGMKHVRDNNMVHFDIKGANMLIGEDGTVKIADFGSSGISTDPEGEVTKGSTNATTPGYAQESQNKKGKKVDHKFDMFALGKLAQVMQTDSPNVGGIKQVDTDGSFDRLITNMTTKDDIDRVSLEGVLESSYLSNLDNYNEEDIEELSRLTIAYTKAARKETDSILKNHFSEEEIQVLEITLDDKKVSREEFNPTDILRKAKLAQTKIPEFEKALINDGEALRQQEEKLKDENLKEEEKSQTVQEIRRLKKNIDLNELLLKSSKIAVRFEENFGTSEETTKIGEQIKEVSFRVTHPGSDAGDFVKAMEFLDTLASTTGRPEQFVGYLRLPSSRESLRLLEVDPIALNQIASIYYMKTSETDEEKGFRQQKGIAWEPRKKIEVALQEVGDFLDGISNVELRDMLGEGLFATVKAVESQLNDFGN